MEWIPRATSAGERPVCDNCERGCELARPGWICGDWIEADERQTKLELPDTAPSDAMIVGVGAVYIWR